MSNDLISRSVLIDELKQSGMIADNDYGNAMVDFINNQPTAYDVDKVVERLEDKQVDRFRNMNLVKDEDGMEARRIYDEFYNQSKAYEDAISIVKGGNEV